MRQCRARKSRRHRGTSHRARALSMRGKAWQRRRQTAERVSRRSKGPQRRRGVRAGLVSNIQGAVAVVGTETR
eukprot:3940107-Rhodomonas_salina.3